MTCEYTCINPLVDWTVYASGKGMNMEVCGQVSSQDAGTLLTVTMTLFPRGLLSLLSPFLKRSFQQGEVKNLANVKAYMEGKVKAAPMVESQ